MIHWNIELVKNATEERGDKLLSKEYINSKLKLRFLCHICGKEFESNWANYYFCNHRHKDCVFEKQKNREKYSPQEMIDYMTKFEYKVLDSDMSKGGKSYLNVICPNGHEYSVRFSNFVKGYRCKKCSAKESSKKRQFTFNEINQYVVEHGNGDLLLSNEYEHYDIKLEFLCHRCGKSWFSTFNNFKIGSRCPACSRKDANEKLVYSSANESYNYGSEYAYLLEEWDWDLNIVDPYSISPGSEIRVNWICSKCGHKWVAKACKRSKENTGCPKCKSSKGEKKLLKFFIDNNIKNEPQYRDFSCRDKYPLPFDYAVWINDVLVLIEYQGILHFKKSDYFGGDEKFEDRKRKDKIKREYCKNNNIKLIEIPYWDFNNIEQILTQELNLQRKEDIIIG